MRRRSVWGLTLAVLGAGTALGQNQGPVPDPRNAVRPEAGNVPRCKELIDFEGLATGTVLSEVFTNNGAGPVLVSGVNPALGLSNAAVIFDSANPTGEDPDLGTPNEDFGGPGIGAAGEAGSPFANVRPLGNLLIVAEDLVDANGDFIIDDPDDADLPGAGLFFGFLCHRADLPASNDGSRCRDFSSEPEG